MSMIANSRCSAKQNECISQRIYYKDRQHMLCNAIKNPKIPYTPGNAIPAQTPAAMQCYAVPAKSPRSINALKQKRRRYAMEQVLCVYISAHGSTIEPIVKRCALHHHHRRRRRRRRQTTVLDLTIPFSFFRLNLSSGMIQPLFVFALRFSPS